MASRFEKETAQTSEKEQQSHRNSAECTSVSSRLHQKTQIFKNHCLRAFQRPFVPTAGDPKRVGKPGVLLRKDFFFLSCRWWKEPFSQGKERIEKTGAPKSEPIIACQRGCCSSRQPHPRGTFALILSSCLLLHVSRVHTRISCGLFLLDCVHLLGSSTLIFNVFEPNEMGEGIIPKTNASIRVSDGVCSGGPAVRNQPCNAGNTGSVSGLGRPHMPQGGWARLPQVTSPRSGCEELQPLSHMPQLLKPKSLCPTREAGATGPHAATRG